MAKVEVGPFGADHHYFQINELTDLTPTRTQAEKRRRDKRGPECSVIHFHKSTEPCKGNKHEAYHLGTTEVIEVTPS
jgi:hypothetical protein